MRKFNHIKVGNTHVNSDVSSRQHHREHRRESFPIHKKYKHRNLALIAIILLPQNKIRSTLFSTDFT